MTHPRFTAQRVRKVSVGGDRFSAIFVFQVLYFNNCQDTLFSQLVFCSRKGLGRIQWLTVLESVQSIFDGDTYIRTCVCVFSWAFNDRDFPTTRFILTACKIRRVTVCSRIVSSLPANNVFYANSVRTQLTTLHLVNVFLLTDRQLCMINKATSLFTNTRSVCRL